MQPLFYNAEKQKILCNYYLFANVDEMLPVFEANK